MRGSAVCGVLSGAHTRSLLERGRSVISQCWLRLRDTSEILECILDTLHIISVKGVSYVCAYCVLTPQAIVSVIYNA